MTSRPKQCWWQLGSVLALCWAVHAPLLQAPFLADDEALVLAAHRRAIEHRLSGYLSPEYWRGEHAGTKGLYRPIREIVFGIVTLHWGLRPTFFRVLNLSLHSLNVVLLFLLVRSTLEDDRVSLVAALLFSLHPAHVEALGFAKNFAEVLSATGALAALLFFLSFLGASPGRRGRPAYYGAGVAFFTLGLLAKEAAVTVPVLLALTAVSVVRKGRDAPPSSGSVGSGQAARPMLTGLNATLPFWILAAVYLLFLTSVDASGGASSDPGKSRAGIVLGTTAFYTRFLLFPMPLTASHTTFLATRVLSPLAIGQACLLLAVVSALVLLALRWRQGMLYALWFPVTILPFLNLVPSGGRLAGEQRLYWPSAGVCVILGCAFSGTMTRSGRRLLAALTATLVICFGGLCFWRSELMATSLRFERYEARHSPEDPSALYKLGKAYSDAGYLRQAIRHLELASESAQRPFLRAGILSELGTAYGRDGRHALAVSMLEKSLALRPDLAGIRESLATALLRLGRTEKAVGYLQEAIARDPSRPGPLVNLAQAYIEMGDLVQAGQRLSEARRRFPNDAIVYVAGAVLASRRHNWHAAVGYLERAVELDPERAATWYRLAAAYHAVGRTEDATRTLEHARRLSTGESVGRRR